MNLASRTLWAAVKAYSRVAPTERGGYRLVRWVRQAIPRGQWQSRFLTPDNFSLDLDLATYPDCCMACGLYELNTARLIRQILRPGMHFVDCGANIGYFTLLAARCVGPKGRVDAFEPDPLNRRRLEEHLHANGLTGQVKVHSVALSDHAGKATLYHPTAGWSNHGQASLFVGPGQQGVEPFLVSLARLDEQLERLPNLIKMDIEGAELAALKGATKFLAMERPPKIIFELNVNSAAAAGYRPVELYDLLRSVQPQYGFYWIGWKQVEIRSREKFEGMTRLGNILIQSSG